MVSILKRMAAGIPGVTTRAEHSTIEPQIITPVGTTGAPTGYGMALVVDNTGGNVGNMRLAASGDADVYGWLNKPYPTSPSSANEPLGTAAPPAAGPISVQVRGYMTVKLYGDAPAVKGGAVFIYTGATTGTHVKGGTEAATTANAVALPDKTYFTGPADASGNVEIAINI